MGLEIPMLRTGEMGELLPTICGSEGFTVVPFPPRFDSSWRQDRCSGNAVQRPTSCDIPKAPCSRLLQRGVRSFRADFAPFLSLLAISLWGPRKYLISFVATTPRRQPGPLRGKLGERDAPGIPSWSVRMYQIISPAVYLAALLPSVSTLCRWAVVQDVRISIRAAGGRILLRHVWCAWLWVPSLPSFDV
ncbi:hypothetical protein BV25DRAFT_1345313 [Artomyces pyxidatus]|uniref:Uncharacterized protein n=1 Tax=Artomyces pyxidatus TaxID=48021 RepID=A0ACB8SQ18_9AGAM|nr:hypothetical protein BV25DRAFT_1345313 [Artomyces pyxidatus]